MTPEEIQEMPIEEIIRLPNFKMLESKGGIENMSEYEIQYRVPIERPHWEITFKAIRIHDGWGVLWKKNSIPELSDI